MKKLLTLLFTIIIHLCGKTQNSTRAVAEHTVNISTCALIYSEDIESMISTDGSAFNCTEIIIQSLPPLTHTYTPFIVDFSTKGKYTFKKHESLEIPVDLKVYFEDNLTGQIFDLVNTDSFTFTVNRSIPKRFVLRIEKQQKLYAKTK